MAKIRATVKRATGTSVRRYETIQYTTVALLERFVRVIAVSGITTAEMMRLKMLIAGTAIGSARDRYELCAHT